MRQVLELNEQVNVAATLIEVAANGRAEGVEPFDAVLSAQGNKLVTMAFENVCHDLRQTLPSVCRLARVGDGNQA
jgi:hypothetical protein